jgi:hypothetical protein
MASSRDFSGKIAAFGNFRRLLSAPALQHPPDFEELVDSARLDLNQIDQRLVIGSPCGARNDEAAAMANFDQSDELGPVDRLAVWRLVFSMSSPTSASRLGPLAQICRQ